MKKIGIYLGGTALVLFLWTAAALAGSGLSDYEALGIRSGAFTIKPKVILGMEFNDNIYATKDDTESDLIFTLAPQVDVRSNWSRHALGLNAGIKGGFYTSEPDESYVDAHLALDGRVDMVRDSFFTGRAGISLLHEERGAPDSLGGWDTPAVYYQADADLSHSFNLGMFSFAYGGGYTMLDYQDVDLVGGGSASLDHRDRNTYNFNARMNYKMHPEVQPFITTRYEWRRYAESVVQRDSEGIRIGLGTGLYLGGVTSMEVFAGYMQQDYEFRSKISGFWTGLNLLWQPTELTAVMAGINSGINETSVVTSSGIRTLDVNFGVDHELRRNMLLGAKTGYTHNDYMDIDRTDGYFSIGPNFTYLINRNFRSSIGFTHKARITDGQDKSVDKYAQNVFTLSFTGQI